LNIAARVDDLTANKAEFATRLGIAVEVYEYTAALSSSRRPSAAGG
jgi:hypothetical protein